MNRTLVERLQRLGIDEADYAACLLPPQIEAVDLIQCEPDVFDRVQFMTPATVTAWCRMQREAQREGIPLNLVSAFRSIDYQCQLIERKLTEGRTLPDILKVNAIPGFSEHHTGQALDLGTNEVEPLTLSFAETAAFDWLSWYAHRFDFYLSFPQDNPFGIDYEPWHWMHRTG